MTGYRVLVSLHRHQAGAGYPRYYLDVAIEGRWHRHQIDLLLLKRLGEDPRVSRAWRELAVELPSDDDGLELKDPHAPKQDYLEELRDRKVMRSGSERFERMSRDPAEGVDQWGLLPTDPGWKGTPWDSGILTSGSDVTEWRYISSSMASVPRLIATIAAQT